MPLSRKKTVYITLSLLLLGILLYVFSGTVFAFIGGWLVLDEKPVKSDAIVVLNTGVEYYPRLIEAAELFNRGLAEKIVINGNRKTDELRELEHKGFVACCLWYEDSLRILSLYGVPRDEVICISAEDAYDTVSEAELVGEAIRKEGFSRIILTTSKSHTRRANFIWKKMYGDRLSICTVTAKADPYEPDGWWRDGRQIRWVLSEYGAWIYYVWKRFKD
jgi:uncharacterized SAM-binding protein YcdF (DUF218 family)